MKWLVLSTSTDESRMRKRCSCRYRRTRSRSSTQCGNLSKRSHLHAMPLIAYRNSRQITHPKGVEMASQTVKIGENEDSNTILSFSKSLNPLGRDETERNYRVIRVCGSPRIDLGTTFIGGGGRGSLKIGRLVRKFPIPQ